VKEAGYMRRSQSRPQGSRCGLKGQLNLLQPSGKIVVKSEERATKKTNRNLER